MKKLIELFRRWRRGEEVEFEGEIGISIPGLLLAIVIIVYLVYTLIKIF